MNNLVIMPTEKRTLNLGEFAEEATISSDYEEKLLGGQQAVVSLYVDASYFLMYRQDRKSVV